MKGFEIWLLKMWDWLSLVSKVFKFDVTKSFFDAEEYISFIWKLPVRSIDAPFSETPKGTTLFLTKAPIS